MGETKRKSAYTTAQTADSRRHITVGGRVITHLTKDIVAPAFGSPRDKCASSETVGSDGSNAAAQPADVHWAGTQCRACIPQLTEGVDTPTFDCATTGQGTAVIQACSDSGDTRQPANGVRRQMLGGGAITQLTIAIIAPTLDSAIVDANAGVTAPSSDGRDATATAQPADCYGRAAVGC